ncbi:MAG TPA: putative toxin-antitoxin system toxin component, PIN family [Thermomicrobiales bacterium]|nr:putative toxin-antitoxin system toxin component, PIN family [Thermomicrobiales bacterium]
MSDRVILDTNIFVGAGFNPRSSSAKILDLIEEGSVALIWNDATLREIEKIIRRIPKLAWEDFARLFQDEHKYTHQAPEGDFLQIEDPDDRKFAALAQATQAVLISIDDHLLSQRANLDIRIMRPSEFLISHQA